MNPWLRWPILALLSPLIFVVVCWVVIVLFFGTICQALVGALVNETPQWLVVDFWRDVVRNGK